MNKKEQKKADLRKLMNTQEDSSTVIPRTVTTEAVSQAKKLPKSELIAAARPIIDTEIQIAEQSGQLTTEEATEVRVLAADPKKANKKKKSGTAGKFLDAITLFAPDAIGLAVGGLIGGSQGAINGAALGGKARESEEARQQQKFENEQDTIAKQLQQQNANTSAGTLALNQKNADTKAAGDTEIFADENSVIAGTAINPLKDPVSGDFLDPRTGGKLSFNDVQNIKGQGLLLREDSIEVSRANSARGFRAEDRKDDQLKDRKSDDDRNFDRDVQKSIESNPTFKAFEDGLAKIKPLKKLLTSGSPFAPATAAIQLNRLLANTGPLSEVELGLFQGSQALKARLRRGFAKVNTGELDEFSRDDILALIEVLETNAVKSQKDIVDKISNRRAAVRGSGTTGKALTDSFNGVNTNEREAKQAQLDALLKKARGE